VRGAKMENSTRMMIVGIALISIVLSVCNLLITHTRVQDVYSNTLDNIKGEIATSASPSDYQFNGEYHGTVVFASTEERVNRIIGYLEPTVDISGIKEIVYSSANVCNGQITTTSDYKYGVILIYDCDVDEDVRGYNVSSKNWLPFVLHHEIGHYALKTNDQDLADDYAYDMTKELGIDVGRWNITYVESQGVVIQMG
jgi:hypothetical protein